MKLRQNREIKKSIKIYRKAVFCGIVGILLISLIVFYTVLNSMENKRTLQVKNDVYSLGRERNETNIYNITINYPQLEDGICLNIDINKVNSLLKDAAFSVYAKTYVKAVAQLEEEVQDAHAYAGDVIDYDLLWLDNDYISLVFSIDSCVGGPSYMHQYPVTIDIEKGQYIYFSDFADINEVLQALQTGNFEVYAGTYSEFSSEDAHAPDVIKQFSETFQEQVSASTTGEGFDRFSSQNIGLDQQYLYIYFPFEKGISFQGYYILGIPKNKLENEN